MRRTKTKMNKSSDVIPKIIFALIGCVICLSCLMLFDVPWHHGSMSTTNEPVEQIEPTSSDPAPAEESPEVPYVHPLAAELFDLTNKVRADAGLNTLTYAYEIQEQADARAYECSVQFSHTRPNGKSCHSVVEQIDYTVTGENLLRADAPLAVPEVMMSEWMLSEGHRANIMLPEFTKLAVGIYEKKGVVYATQIFLG